ncbi:MAG: MaoC/PaaZ C-terminal domain-containing protein [Bacteroidia bacterium]
MIITEKLNIRELKVEQVLDFGSLTLSDDDIINFAKAYDPLPFHTDKKIAEASIFRGLVSSGPQLFNTFYKREWIPRLGHSVLCGLEINSWKFLIPVYANQPITCKVMVKQLRKNEEKGHAVITWNYQFFNPKGQMVQIADITVMHKL